MTSITIVCNESSPGACDGITKEEAENFADWLLDIIGFKCCCNRILINNKVYYDIEKKEGGV